MSQENDSGLFGDITGTLSTWASDSWDFLKKYGDAWLAEEFSTPPTYAYPSGVMPQYQDYPERTAPMVNPQAFGVELTPQNILIGAALLLVAGLAVYAATK